MVGAFVSPAATVVINEIYFHPPDKRPLEFVELFNPDVHAIDLTGWNLNKYIFPSNTVIEPSGYLVVAADVAAFSKEYGFKPLGPLPARLKNSGSDLRLQDSQGHIIDDVHYGVGFPWPTAAGGGGSSLERINPSLQGNTPGSWRSSGFPIG